MFKRLKKLFEIKRNSLFVFCVLLVGVGISITMPYLSLYCTEKLGMSAGAYGIFVAISFIGGVVTAVGRVINRNKIVRRGFSCPIMN